MVGFFVWWKIYLNHSRARKGFSSDLWNENGVMVYQKLQPDELSAARSPDLFQLFNIY